MTDNSAVCEGCGLPISSDGEKWFAVQEVKHQRVDGGIESFNRPVYQCSALPAHQPEQRRRAHLTVVTMTALALVLSCIGFAVPAQAKAQTCDGYYGPRLCNILQHYMANKGKLGPVDAAAIHDYPYYAKNLINMNRRPSILGNAKGDCLPGCARTTGKVPASVRALQRDTTIGQLQDSGSFPASWNRLWWTLTGSYADFDGAYGNQARMYFGIAMNNTNVTQVTGEDRSFENTGALISAQWEPGDSNKDKLPNTVYWREWRPTWSVNLPYLISGVWTQRSKVTAVIDAESNKYFLYSDEFDFGPLR